MTSSVTMADEIVPYIGVGGLLTNLESADGSFSDYAVGYKLLGGAFWDKWDGHGFGLEAQYSDSLDAKSGGVELSIDGFTGYVTWTSRPWIYWDASAKLGWTYQDPSSVIPTGSDNGLAAAGVIRRWFGNVGVGVGAEWYNVNFSGATKEPWRGELLIEYRF